MTQEEKDKIIRSLTEKGAMRSCPRCDKNNFSLLDGYFNHPLQANPATLMLGGLTVPTIAIVCTNCGFLAEHALGSLGLLSQPPNK